MYNKELHLRLRAVSIFFYLSFLVFLIRILFLQLIKTEELTLLATRQHQFYLKLMPQRGRIFDRNLKPLAFNISRDSLYAIASKIENKERVAKLLSSLLNIEASSLLNKLDKKKRFVWLARKVQPQIAKEIKALEIEGLEWLREYKRSYPEGNLASHLIGFTDLDNQGIEGLELFYESYLKGYAGWQRLKRDAKQRRLHIEEEIVPSRDGYELVLNIDSVLQYLAERELERAYLKYQAQAASIVVIEPFTGEILAMANRPTFDPNSPSKYEPAWRRNRAISDFFEPGSVFKIVTASAALEEEKFQEKDRLFCENGAYRVANHILHDHKPHGWLSFREVFEKSSNIGVTKIAQSLGADLIYRYAHGFGFGEPSQVDLPGEVRGILKRPRLWSKTSIGAIPIGQEVCVTALQLVRAVACVANGGWLVKPYVVKHIQDREGNVIKSFLPKRISRAMSEKTALGMKQILKGVIENGTGRLAKSSQFILAGKTGTAQKISKDGGYSHSHFIASFLGFAPFDHPRLCVAIVIDEPKGLYYGGVVAAPVFKNFITKALEYLELKPLDTVKFLYYERENLLSEQ